MNKMLCRWLCIVSLLSGPTAGTGWAASNQDDASGSASGETIVGTTWEWVETTTPDGRIDVGEPERYTIRLKRNGEAQLRFDCNHGGSFYEISGGKLSFGPLTATRVPCPDGSHGPVYMKQLGAVQSFFTEEGFLYLKLPGDSGTMRFRRAGSS